MKPVELVDAPPPPAVEIGPAADSPAANMPLPAEAKGEGTPSAPGTAIDASVDPSRNSARWTPPSRSRLARIAILSLIAVAIAGILYGWQLPPFGGRYEQTDNAYVRGQTTIISPQVSGYV